MGGGATESEFEVGNMMIRPLDFIRVRAGVELRVVERTGEAAGDGEFLGCGAGAGQVE